ncbi:type I polyketide synthase [Amycolatopsis keratiniphila]|uniref:type I polyketide synthase n=1 Tax=Amycolatopsis keratiniphila TaxID=129921 RepID=UPI0003A283B6|nr:type I polyketide synthase [Amycolatopsis keratiniphila]
MKARPSDFSDQIAIIGMGCRFPGGINSPDALWAHLKEARSAVSDLPEGRWDAYPAPSEAASGAVRRMIQRASYLDDTAGFDAGFFGITPREAEQMDPQQRIVLEVAWESLEHAGIPPRSLAGSVTAVVMGVGGNEYGQLLLSDASRIGPYSSIGGAYCAVANRVSYALDLLGPSYAVDSACSSSLVAVHAASQALRSGEADLALAGGVNLIPAPGQSMSLAASGAMAPDGRSKPFSAQADGYGRGEGAGALVLKRKSDALRDGDRILATIVASAVAQDGRTSGIMAPNGTAQAALLRGLYEKAGVDPASVHYVEAHGTGTSVGDPIEAGAIASVLGTGRADGEVLIGSIKGNIGHLEAGAGIAGVMKTVLAMTHELLPSTVGPDGPAGVLPDITTMPGVRVVDAPTPWPRGESPRRAGVSSFGYGGTIAHVCLEEPAVSPLPPRTTGKPSTQVLVLSAASAPALRDAAGRLADAVRTGDDRPDLGSAAHTLAVRRSHLPHRLAVVAENWDQAVERLDAVSAEKPDDGVVVGRANEPGPGPVWVFSGHGSHWAGMGRELLRDSAEFAQSCQRLDPVFRQEAGFSLLEEIRHGEFTEVDRIQAALIGIQLGLARMWRARGVRPAAVIGHSVGEISAAAVAGVWSEEDAVRFACRRASLLRSVAGAGAMVMVALPFPELSDRLAGRTDVTAAIHPSPDWSVASGDPAAIDELVREWQDRGLTVRRIASDVAFHSAQMEPLLADLGAAAAPLGISEPCLPLYSTALRDPRSDSPRDPLYWRANLREPVRFGPAIQAALEDGYRTFIEVSTHPVVTHSIMETAARFDSEPVLVVHTLRRRRSQLQEFLAQTGKLYCGGAAIDWAAALPGRLVDLPTQPWRHERFWLPPARPEDTDAHDPAGHTLLGRRIDVSSVPPTTVWTTSLAPESRPYPTPHVVHGVDIVPAAVLMGTLGAAAGGRSDIAGGYHLRDISLRTPLPADQRRAVQILSHEGQLTLSSRLADEESGGNWIVHTTAHVAEPTGAGAPDPYREPLAGSQSFSEDELLGLLAPLGVTGVAFPWEVRALQHDAAEVDAHVLAPDAETWAPLFDAATTLAALPMARQGVRRMPTFIESVRVCGPVPRDVQVHARLRSGTSDVVDVDVISRDGASTAQVRGLRFGILDASDDLLSDPRRLLHRLDWQPMAEFAVTGRAPVIALVAPGPSPLVDRIAQRAAAEDITCITTDCLDALTGADHVLVFPGDTEAPVRQTELNLGLLARTAQALLSRGEGTARLWAVTAGARECRDDRALSQRPLWGAGRVIASEHPDLWGGTVDLGAEGTDEAIGRLLRLLHHPPAEDWVALDGPAPEAARMVPVSGIAPAPLRCAPDGTYVVTGGLGALGLEAARYLVAHGARRLVLIGRRGLPERGLWAEQTDPAIRHAIDVITSLEQLGVTVQPYSLDIADPDAARILTRADALGLPPVRGIVHAAGVFSGGVIDELDETSIHTNLHAKAAGAYVLHELFPPGTLDFLVFFSSTAPLVVLPGCTAYAGANSFLDALAHYRRAQAPDTKALAWTAWRNTGMGASFGALEQDAMDSQGFGDITVVEALRAWEYADAMDAAQAIIVRPTQLPDMQRRPIFEHVKSPKSVELKDDSPAGAALRSADPETLAVTIVEEITRHIAEETGLPGERIEDNVPFADLGLDSVMAIAIRSRLQRSIELDLPITVLWTNPTPAALARHLTERLVAKRATSGAADRAPSLRT